VSGIPGSEGHRNDEDPWTAHWRWTAIGAGILIDNLNEMHHNEMDGGGLPTGNCKCGLPAPCPTVEAIGAYRAKRFEPCTCWRQSGGECPDALQED
jgi:hypothetical protein